MQDAKTNVKPLAKMVDNRGHQIQTAINEANERKSDLSREIIGQLLWLSIFRSMLQRLAKGPHRPHAILPTRRDCYEVM